MTNKINSNQSYKYTIELGPVSFKKTAQFNGDIKNLNTLIECLKKYEPKKLGQLSRLKLTQNDVSVKLTRIWNLLFGTREWYNENRARQLLKQYVALNSRQGLVKNEPNDQADLRQAQLLALYDRLESVSVIDKRDYLKGINKNDLLEKSNNFLKECLEVLPEMTELKNVLKPLFIATSKKAAELALDMIEHCLACSLGERNVPFTGIKAAKLMKDMILALSRDIGLDIAKINLNIKRFKPEYETKQQLAIVPYRE